MKKTYLISILTLVIIFLSVLYPNFALAQGKIELQNPLGVSSIQDLFTSLMSRLETIIGTLAVLFIIIGSIMYILSSGNEEMATKAKKTITAAIIGLAIAVGARTFLKEIWEILGVQGQGAAPGGLTLREIIVNILELLLSIVGVLAIIGMVIGGIMYLTSYGDTDRIETAKKIFTYSIIGITIALGSLIIVKQVSNLIAGS